MANRKDRIHLRTTHYKYARHLESLGQYSKAIRQYELSKTHTAEVPRMMYNANKTNELEEYIRETQEIKLLRWWGQYLESDQDIKAAFEFYQHAGDSMAMMRIRCFSQEWKKAEKLVKNADPDGMQRPLAYHLAREYEGVGEEKVKEAIDMYVKAGRYNHAIRLAIANEFDIDIMQLAMQCPDPPVVKIAARYFEQRGDMDKAISLYRQVRCVLCFACAYLMEHFQPAHEGSVPDLSLGSTFVVSLAWISLTGQGHRPRTAFVLRALQVRTAG